MSVYDIIMKVTSISRQPSPWTGNDRSKMARKWNISTVWTAG